MHCNADKTLFPICIDLRSSAVSILRGSPGEKGVNGIGVSGSPEGGEAVVAVDIGVVIFGDELRVIGGCAGDAVAHEVDVNDFVVDAGDSIDGDERLLRADSEEAAGGDSHEADAFFAVVDEQIVDLAD